MGNRTDQDHSRRVGERLAPPTTPSKNTIREDRSAPGAPHEAGPGPTPDEEAAIDETAQSASVGEHYREMIERGAAQEGEGKPGV